MKAYKNNAQNNLEEMWIVWLIFGIVGCVFGILMIFVLPPIGIGLLIAGGIFLYKATSHFQRQSKIKNMRQQPLTNYVIFDFETTGLNPRTDRIIQIGAVKVINGNVVDTFSTYVNPMKNITKKSIEINGITNEMVMDAPTEDQALPDFFKFIYTFPVTAYNSSFDLSFLREALKRMNMTADIYSFDTLKIARLYFPNLPNHRLSTVVNAIGGRIEKEHDALSDCFGIKQILDRVPLTNAIIEQHQSTSQ
ncbi:MAG TPA: hypothetical protein DEP65_01215 [Ruminococcus sp.]|nr:hypothetical protein [Ruminococcus sp.]